MMFHLRDDASRDRSSVSPLGNRNPDGFNTLCPKVLTLCKRVRKRPGPRARLLPRRAPAQLRGSRTNVPRHGAPRWAALNAPEEAAVANPAALLPSNFVIPSLPP